MRITAVLNGYKRGAHLASQLSAINGQTIPPVTIMLWQNQGEAFDPALSAQTVHAGCNVNLGVWARFAYALNANTEYICVFDDDTIPGRRWFENCLNTLSVHDGLLGTVGVRYHTTSSYFPFSRVGWVAPNESTEQVDIVGHAWFFRRDWLSCFWRELPGYNQSRLVGEDMHFSYTLQKYLGLNTYVPPHPKGQLDLWGSMPQTGMSIGQDAAAISMNPANMHLMSHVYVDYIRRGFRIMAKSRMDAAPLKVSVG
jgi:hypothetical protein